MTPYPWKIIDYDKRNLIETLDSTIWSDNRLADRTLDAVRFLPPVDQNGNSPCFFAEEAYAAKEEKEEELSRNIPLRRKDQQAADEKFSKLTKQLAGFQRWAPSIETAEPRARLSDGERYASQALDKVRKQQAALAVLIDKMEWVLAKSRKVKFPGRKPRKSQPGGSGFIAPVRPRIGEPFSPGASLTPGGDPTNRGLGSGPASLLSRGPRSGSNR